VTDVLRFKLGSTSITAHMPFPPFLPPSLSSSPQEVCQAVMVVREHKDKCIRVSVLEILPRLAHFCSDMFARSYLEDALSHLLIAVKNPELRPQAFLALGKLALAVGEYLRPYLSQILGLVREYMSNKHKR